MLENIQKLINRFVLALLVLSVILMLGLTLLNIALRLFETTLVWVEPLVRHLVFLSAFLGASLASARGEHIKIDILSKLIKSEKGLKLYDIFIQFFTIVVLFFLIKAGLNFYSIEKDYASEVFLFFNNYHLVGIIPFGFGVLIIQSILRCLIQLKGILNE